MSFEDLMRLYKVEIGSIEYYLCLQYLCTIRIAKLALKKKKTRPSEREKGEG